VFDRCIPDGRAFLVVCCTNVYYNEAGLQVEVCFLYAFGPEKEKTVAKVVESGYI